MKDKIKNTSNDPDLYVDGEKINFHYNREERLSKLPYRPQKTDSIFSKKFRHMHILILDIVFILILGLVFSVLVGKSKSHIDNGIKYHFSKKFFTDMPIVDLRLQIKNISRNNKVLDDVEMEIDLINENNETVYEKDFLIPKQIFKPDEFYTEYFFIDKPIPGKYRSIVKFGPDKIKSLELQFTLR